MMKIGPYAYTRRKVARRGRQDGRDWKWKFFPFTKELDPNRENDPPVDYDKPSQYEIELREHAEVDLDRVAKKWADLDRKLHDNCRQAENEYQRRKKAADAFGETHGDKLKAYNTAKENLLGLPSPHLSKLWYWILISLIAASEIVFNGMVFMILGQDQIDTYIIAGSIMIMIPWFSHFIGKSLRMEHKSKTRIALTVLFALAMLGLLLDIAVAREKYFEAAKVVAALGIEWTTGSITLIFLIINIGLFLLVVGLSFEAGHKDPDTYNKAKKAFEDAEATLKKEGAEIFEAEKRLASAENAFDKMHTMREKGFQEVQQEAEEERDAWVGFVQLYRAANMKTRLQKRTPKSFEQDPETLVNLPKTLTSLDCGTCSHEASGTTVEEDTP